MIRAKTRIAILTCAAAPFAMIAPVAARADAVVNVRLQDPSSDAHPADMTMLLDHSVVTAGRITIHAVNESKRLVHEVIVYRDDNDALPYNEATGRVIEKQLKSHGEISDLDAGAAGDKTFNNLEPGNYLLICNQANHMKGGMFARLKVVPAGTAITDDKPTAAMMAAPKTKAVQVDASKDGDDDGS